MPSNVAERLRALVGDARLVDFLRGDPAAGGWVIRPSEGNNAGGVSVYSHPDMPELCARERRAATQMPFVFRTVSMIDSWPGDGDLTVAEWDGSKRVGAELAWWAPHTHRPGPRWATPDCPACASARTCTACGAAYARTDRDGREIPDPQPQETRCHSCRRGPPTAEQLGALAREGEAARQTAAMQRAARPPRERS